jgi:Raf kinase inhibitor-like YbhB/YbcL family protein
MKKFTLVISALSTFLIYLVFNNCLANDFTFYSQDIKSNKKISNKYVFNGFGCSGQNISPRFFVKNPPSNAKSFAITVYDPDAPTGSGFWHWIVLNIPTNFNFSKQITEDAFITLGINQIRNDYGTFSYGGPCPPVGDKAHSYIFTIHALDVDKIDINADTTNAIARFLIKAHSINSASFTAFFSR